MSFCKKIGVKNRFEKMTNELFLIKKCNFKKATYLTWQYRKGIYFLILHTRRTAKRFKKGFFVPFSEILNNYFGNIEWMGPNFSPMFPEPTRQHVSRLFPPETIKQYVLQCSHRGTNDFVFSHLFLQCFHKQYGNMFLYCFNRKRWSKMFR